MPEDNSLILGEIRGSLPLILKRLDDISAKQDGMDSRLRAVENRSAIAGAAGALLVTIGIELGRLMLKKA